MKTADLIGPALDWAVGTALGVPVEVCQIFQYGKPNGKHYISIGETDKDGAEVDFEPSMEWAQGGPIIEREELGLKRNAPCSQGREWEASPSITAKGAGGKWGYGPTPLVAAMRCFVASWLGDEVEVPKELL